MVRFLLTLFLLFIACTNPFSTREPDPPRTSNQPLPSNVLQNHPDSLLAKLQYAFQDANRFYYKECLADSSQPDIDMHFTFIATQDERDRLTGWTRQDEINYFDQLSSNDEIESKTLQIYDTQPEWTPLGGSQDSLQNRFSYQIVLKFKTRKETYEGQGIFKIIRSNQSLWYIYYWEDLPSGSDQIDGTWSTLKANYR